MTYQQAIVRLREEVAKRGTQVAVAKWLGVTKSHVTDLLHGRRNPGPAILKKLHLNPSKQQTKGS